jgi:hypothetical protein
VRFDHFELVIIEKVKITLVIHTDESPGSLVFLLEGARVCFMRFSLQHLKHRMGHRRLSDGPDLPASPVNS